MAPVDGSQAQGADTEMDVVLTIVSARGLKDTGSHGTSECYCRCWVQGDQEGTEFSTDGVKRSTDASWEYQMTLPDCVRGQTLEFEVWDQDDGISHKDVLGSATLLLSPDHCVANRSIEQGLPLNCDGGGVQGTLLVTVEGAPLADEPQDGEVESEAALQQADVTVVGGAADGDDGKRGWPLLTPPQSTAESASTADGEELPGILEVGALTALLQRKSAGSVLRGWRKYFDPEGATQVRRQKFWQGCKELGDLHLAKPIWQELSLDGVSLKFSSLFPREQACLESLAAVLFSARGTDLESVWEFLDPQRKNRLCFKDFEKGLSKLGFSCGAKSVFDGIVKERVLVFREDFLYLRLFLWGWLQPVPGSIDNTLAELRGHVRQELGSPEAFVKRLGLREDETISEHEFAARLSAMGFLGNSALVANRLARKDTRADCRTEIHASSLASLLSDEGHRSNLKTSARAGQCETPRTPRSQLTSGPKTSARAGQCETPRTPRSQLSSGPKLSARAGWCEGMRTPRSQLSSGEPVEWDDSVKDVGLHNKGKHPALRAYFSQAVREEEEYEDADRSSSPIPASAEQPAAHCAPDQVPLLALPPAGETGGARSPRAGLQRSQTMQRHQSPTERRQTVRRQTVQRSEALSPGNPRVPTCRMLHFEATKLRGGQSGYKASIDALVFYRCGEPVKATSVSKVPYIVSFESPMEIDEMRFRTDNADPSLDIVQWHVWGSKDGEVWFDVHDQAEDFPTRHGRIARQLLVGDEEHDMLRVYVSEATGLKNNASSKNRGVSDPYCTIWVDRKPDTKCHTEVFPTSRSPKWDARLELRGYEEGDDLRVMVRHSRFGLSAKTSKEDTLLGEARVPSSSLSPHGFDGWVDLDEGAGRVYLNIRPLKEACISKEHRFATAQDPLELWLCDTLVF